MREQRRAQGASAQKFHDNEKNAVVGDASIMHGDDVRVIEKSQRAGLLLPTLSHLARHPVRRVNDLDCDLTSRDEVQTSIDPSLPAAAQVPNDFVLALKPTADSERPLFCRRVHRAPTNSATIAAVAVAVITAAAKKSHMFDIFRRTGRRAAASSSISSSALT